MPNEAYKSLGIITLALGWLTLGFAFYKWPVEVKKSISKHASAYRSTYLIMAVMQTLIYPLFLVFVFGWLMPTFHLPSVFGLFITLTFLGLLVAAWIPDTFGIKSKVHRICAYGAAALMIPIVLIIFLSSNVSMVARIISLFAACYMFIVTYLFAFVKNARNNHLYFQAIYFALFDLSILATVYIR